MRVFSWNSLPEVLKSILPQNYSYLIENFNELPSYRITENFIIPQFELDIFVDIDNEEKAREWFMAFESKSKTTMPETKRSQEIKCQQSSRLRNTNCTLTIHLRLERWRIKLSHPWKSTSNSHITIAADEQELLLLLADRASNPDYDYIFNLFRQYHQDSLGDRNGSAIFRRLAEVVNDYNNSGKGRAILQEYDSHASASFEPLNTSITLLYTSCAVRALPFGLFITSDKLKITLEKALNLLKSILS
ncbi:hypothetical protein RhiirC2_800185 [Rhizophagus irregularis]|uniref:Uncharacterized protein n=1 Tax=Rhizophagus irregularis TaxID=588596 RepID=A0A2N1M403_9GLOM|nr:hypothetical protein RhiirC2_800185 [Rhizophagus irregularis]